MSTASFICCVVAVLVTVAIAVVVLLWGALLWGAADEIVACAEDGTDSRYVETISRTMRTVVTNGCPNHPIYHGAGAGVATNKEATYQLPLLPYYSPAQQTALTSTGGQIGVARSGAMVYSAYIPSVPAAVGLTTSAPYIEGDTFDQCDGHASEQNGEHSNYHYHVPPSCLLRQLGIAAGVHSPQIGWMADGFPLYGPLGPHGAVMKTCTVTGGTEGVDVCLDACAGYAADTGDGYVYRYYVLGEFSDGECCTVPNRASSDYDGAYFPFTPACLRGCIPTGVRSQGFGALVPGCHADHASPGTTSRFVASAAEALPTYSASCAAADVCDSLEWRSACEPCEFSTAAPQQRTLLEAFLDMLEAFLALLADGFPTNAVVAVGAVTLLAGCAVALACRARARRKGSAWNQLDERREEESRRRNGDVFEMQKAPAGCRPPTMQDDARDLNAFLRST